MLLLSSDTSGKSGGITLAEGDQQSFRVLGASPIAGGSLSGRVVENIAALLEKYGFAVKDIGGFAVVSGPGSFTWFRGCLSAVEGLREVLGNTCAAVSLLGALAAFSGKPGRVAAALDAGRAQVFLGFYQVSAAAASRISENLLSQPEFLRQLNNENLAAAITNDAALAELASAAHVKVQFQVVDRPGSEMIARIGLKKLLAGETVSGEALDANYIRSDTELLFKGNR